MKKLLILLILALPLAAQQGSIPCAKTGADLPLIPEIRSVNGVLAGTLYTVSEQVNMTTFPNGAGTDPVCFPQWVRAYRRDAPKSWDPPASELLQPMAGPTLRARVGEVVTLTFLNSIDSNKFPNADQGGCDRTVSAGGTEVYPGKTGDKDPDCFAGSVFTNVHYHGTHTSPNTTADNVFLNIKPSPRDVPKGNVPIVTLDSVKQNFDQFFADCRAQLEHDTGPKVWPRRWSDLRPPLQEQLMELVRQYGVKGWYEANENLIANGNWPQYYVGAYPYCFKIPEHIDGTVASTVPPSVRSPHTHGAGIAEVDEAKDPNRKLIMGQSPGTHWYHAHKHGSTTINVMNGMTGVFIIEGAYDDALNAYYGSEWTRRQPVLVIQQLGAMPSLLTGGGGGPGPDFSVNGRLRPVVRMAGNSVQMWRIANNAGRAGVYFPKPAANTLQWKQLAQDGVQFSPDNYWNNLNDEILLASGNRADLLVKAPPYVKGGKNTYDVIVYNTVDASDRPPAKPGATPFTLVTVVVTPNGAAMDFIPKEKAPALPKFLADITDEEVTGTKILRFASTPLTTPPNPASRHTIDDTLFNGELGAVVELNRTEEWKIVNETYPPSTGNQISHPFHIHVNPFQISEVFDPNAILSSKRAPAGATVALTQGSATVAGTNTAFRSDFKPGDFIIFHTTSARIAAPARVVSVASDTEMTIDINARATQSGIEYSAALPAYTADAKNARSGQCVLDPDNSQTWKPCSATEPAKERIWWDVFSIPSGNIFTYTAADGTTKTKKIPGYFKMRSRFVDYPGYFVLHCHILAHEDRGMMTVVGVTPIQTPYSHH